MGAEIAAGRERQEYRELILHSALETAITHRLISNTKGGRQLIETGKFANTLQFPAMTALPAFSDSA